jgi:predicted XRE-type DNA-binding protein
MSNEEKTVFERGSGNVFEDLGFPDAKELLVKANIALAIQREINARGLRQVDAAKLMGISQPNVSNILRGRLDDYSIDRLIRLLNTLGLDVEMSIVPKMV